jgi:tetratricopeptide (TPR) repeat protein
LAIVSLVIHGAIVAPSSRAKESTSPTSTNQPSKPVWESTVEKAEQSLLDNDPDQCAKFCADALAAAPDQIARATVHNQIGVIEMQQHRFRDAKESFAKALDLRKTYTGVDAPLTLQSMSNLALATYKSGSAAEAKELYKHCIERKRVAVPQSNSLANTLTNFANVYSDERNCPEAKNLYQEALEIDTKVFGANHKEVATDLFNLGALHYRCNQFEDALAYLDKAQQVYTAIDDKYGTMKCLHYQSLCYSGLQQFDKSVEQAMRSLELHEQIAGKGHPDTIVHLLNAAQSLDAAGSTDKAEQLLKQALQSAKSAADPSNLCMAECNLELAQFCRRHGDNDQSEQYFKAALVHYDALTKKQKRDLYEIPQAYSELLHGLKKNAESEEIAHRYLEVYAPPHQPKVEN